MRRHLLPAAAVACLTVSLAGPLLAQCDPVSVESPQPAVENWFGRAVATDGEWVFVASPGDDTVANLSGVVDVYRVTALGAQHTQRLFSTNQTGNMIFGWAMDADDGRLVVSAPYLRSIIDPQGPTTFPPGVVFVFEEFNGFWFETSRIVPSNGANEDQFGISVAISGTHLLVGADQQDQVTPNGGLVYAYEATPTGWTEVQRIGPGGLQSYTGQVVEVEGDLCAVRSSSGIPSLLVNVWRWTGTQWTFVRFIGVTDSAYTDGFGLDLSLSGSGLAVSAPAYTGPGATGDGVVFLYEDVATPSVPPLILNGSIPTGNVNFGARVELSGAHLFATDRPFGAGSIPNIYRFRTDGVAWTEVERFTNSTNAEDDGYADAIALSGAQLVAGAWLANTTVVDAGRVWVYHREVGLSAVCPCDLVAACGAVSPDGGCINSTGLSARLRGCGTASVIADDLTLIGTGIPPSQFVLPFMGNSLIPATVLGAGRRCAGGSVKRFAPQLVGTSGEVQIGPGLAALSANLHGAAGIVAGSTWTFQLWYRDNAQVCSNVNLTDGLTVQFHP